MLSEKRTIELRDSLLKRMGEIMEEGKRKGYDEYDMNKINFKELRKLRDQVEILDVVIEHNNQ